MFRRSNTDENNLKAFVMCTLNVADALPLSILITSDEKTETVISAFSMLNNIIPEYAFPSLGKTLGAALIMTDICSFNYEKL